MLRVVDRALGEASIIVYIVFLSFCVTDCVIVLYCIQVICNITSLIYSLRTELYRLFVAGLNFVQPNQIIGDTFQFNSVLSTPLWRNVNKNGTITPITKNWIYCTAVILDCTCVSKVAAECKCWKTEIQFHRDVICQVCGEMTFLHACLDVL